MILVDTSIWIDHFRAGDTGLGKLLTAGLVLTHPFVLGELSCGNFKNRESTLGYLNALPSAQQATHTESMHVLERRKLHGRGIGWVDVHLLTSALLTKCGFWTRDARLDEAATIAGVKCYTA